MSAGDSISYPLSAKHWKSWGGNAPGLGGAVLPPPPPSGASDAGGFASLFSSSPPPPAIAMPPTTIATSTTSASATERIARGRLIPFMRAYLLGVWRHSLGRRSRRVRDQPSVGEAKDAIGALGDPLIVRHEHQ